MNMTRVFKQILFVPYRGTVTHMSVCDSDIPVLLSKKDKDDNTNGCERAAKRGYWPGIRHQSLPKSPKARNNK